MTVAASELASRRELVEWAIGRPLRKAEQAIDVVRLNGALEQAKDELEAAIRAEMLEATASWLSGRAVAPALRVTQRMLDVLQTLEELGREEARLELERLGYHGIRRRRFVDTPAPVGRDYPGYLQRNLPGIQLRIEDDLIHADLGTSSLAAVERALATVPGARDIASRVISTALIAGMAQTWEENQDLVRCWEYTAVLDATTCEECEPLDGTEYHSLDDLFEVLPDFGPNPACYGEGRCRCRAVPCDTSEAGQNIAPPADPELPEGETLPAWMADITAARAGVSELSSVYEHFKTPLATLEAQIGQEAALTYKDALDRFVRTKNARGDYVPAPKLGGVRDDVIRAGDAVSSELDSRVAARVTDLPDQAALEAAVEEKTAAWKATQEELRGVLERQSAEENALLAELRTEVEALQPDRPSWEVYRDAYNHPRRAELIARHEAEAKPLQDRAAVAAQVKREATAALRERAAAEMVVQRDALLELLGELREMGAGDLDGWTYTTSGRRGAAKLALDEAARYYPRDWIVRGRENPIKPTMRKNGRGYHRSGSTFSEVVLSARIRGPIKDEIEGLEVALHELGHHLEYVDGRIRALEWAFYDYRTRASIDAIQEADRRFPRGLGYGAHETYRQDGFRDAYMGKTYGNSASSSYELLSMGIESLFTGSYALDAEMRSFILGLLALL